MRVRLFCFPYAGGGVSIFRSWQENLPVTIEVCPVQLPGRGARTAEPPYTELDQLVGSIGHGLAPLLDEPFAFFGHSMGALIAFELARHLKQEYRAEPVHLFVSGRCSPQTVNEPFDLELIGSRLSEMLADSELMELMLPVLRADVALCQSYVYTPGPPFSFPITAFGGLDDRGVSRTAIEGWRQHTTGPFVLRMLPGDHLFLNTSTAPLLEAISRELDADLTKRARGK